MEPLTIPPRSSEEYAERSLRADAHEDHPTPPEKKQSENFFVEVIKFAVLALVIVVPFRVWIAQPFIVSGASMSPTFETGQYLIIDQVSYRFHEPERGDVIIFRYPNDPSKYFIKRVIGLPGEIVSLADGTTSITDPATNRTEMLNEDYYLIAPHTDDHLTITLSSDEYFVMGDNRPQSSDSRVWGPVPKSNIVGKAFVRLLPPQRIGILPGEYRFAAPTEANVNVVPQAL